MSAPGRQPAPTHRGLVVALVLAIYAALSVAGYWQAWTQGASAHALSPGGDQATSMWFLTWVAYAVVHLHNPFVSSFGNYPYGVNTMVNGQPLPLDLLVTPVTLLAGPVVSYNLIGTLSPFASAAAAFFLVRRFVTWQPAAFVGGLLYGFSPYVVGQGVGHIFLEFVALPPLIFMVVHDLVVRQPDRPVARGLLLGLLAALQLTVSAEVLLSTAIMALGGVIALAVVGHRHWRDHLRFAAVGGGTALVSGAVLMAYPLWMMFRGPAHVVGPVQTSPGIYRADLLGAVWPDDLQRFAPHAFVQVADKFAGNGSENGSYLGLPLVLLLVIAVIALWRNRTVAVAAVLAVLAWLVSLGSHLTVHNKVTGILLPEALYDKIPVLKNAIPVRYSLYVDLFAALILAIAVDKLRRAALWKGNRWMSVCAPLVIGLGVLVPLVPAWPYTMVPTGTPSYFTTGAAGAIPRGSVALVYPFPDALFADPQLWQADTFLRFKSPGGRFNVPQPPTNMSVPSRMSLTDTILSELSDGQPVPEDPALRQQLVDQWHSWKVTTVVAVPGGQDFAQALSYLSWVLGSAPASSSGVDVWYHWH